MERKPLHDDPPPSPKPATCGHCHLPRSAHAAGDGPVHAEDGAITCDRFVPRA